MGATRLKCDKLIAYVHEPELCFVLQLQVRVLFDTDEMKLSPFLSLSSGNPAEAIALSVICPHPLHNV